MLTLTLAPEPPVTLEATGLRAVVAEDSGTFIVSCATFLSDEYVADEYVETWTTDKFEFPTRVEAVEFATAWIAS